MGASLLLGPLTICVKNDALLIPHDEMCNEEREALLFVADLNGILLT